ncbi:MAG: fused MFS/spermidine synthase [Legionellales bacterium]|nr:fused MFS/spermidine synthase [Legionellales bacterium]
MFGLLSVYGNNTIHKNKSVHGSIQVVRFNNMLCMRFKGVEGNYSGRQGCIYNDSNKMIFSYAKVLMGSLLMVNEPKRILFIGLGVGILPLAMRQTVPDAIIDVVELDPNVIKVAKSHFNWPDDDEYLLTHVIDGRKFVKNAISISQKYDIVILDAFDDKYIPAHLMTYEFFEEINNILKQDGVFGANTFTRSNYYHNESATYQKVFGDFFNVVNYENSGNRVVLAKKNRLVDKQEMYFQAKKYRSVFKEVYDIDIDELIENMKINKNWRTKAKVLKDS